MNWTSVAQFVAMGGYGSYVWGAFGVTAAAMAGEMLALRARRQAMRDARTPLRAGAAPDRMPIQVEYREGAA